MRTHGKVGWSSTLLTRSDLLRSFFFISSFIFFILYLFLNYYILILLGKFKEIIKQSILLFCYLKLHIH
jgi:hypothetical protein